MASARSSLSMSERYKVCRKLRRQQIESYLNFLEKEEQAEKEKYAKDKPVKDDRKRKKKEEKKGKKQKRKATTEDCSSTQGVSFSLDLRLQSCVEEQDEKGSKISEHLGKFMPVFVLFVRCNLYLIKMRNELKHRFF
ncbi:hypothetical protein ElyMa_006599600 [Elysia marginata]|uniref:Uncharacterized protein n=1 Tax=Elysia marginata TaxID=1093978 RepID=A0AAV4IIT3_9GAST|nr:hypothetical protein ElyMa_006599600 [Elysia marginata]